MTDGHGSLARWGGVGIIHRKVFLMRLSGLERSVYAFYRCGVYGLAVKVAVFGFKVSGLDLRFPG